MHRDPAMDVLEEDIDSMLDAGDLARVKALIAAQGVERVAEWRDTDGDSILTLAVIFGCSSDLLRVLIDTGVDLDAEDNGESAIFHAETAEAVRVLAEAGASLAQTNLYRRTPLACACMWARDEVVQALLVAGSSIPRVLFATSRTGKTARDYAALQKRHGIVELLDTTARGTRAWQRRCGAMRVGLAAADIVKEVALAFGKTWAL